MKARLACCAGLLLTMTCRPASPAQRRYVVEVRQMAFVPAVLTVGPGDTVVWINRDLFPHTATAAAPARWDTGSIGAGEGRSIVADQVGEFTYFCAFHPTMLARVIVR